MLTLHSITYTHPNGDRVFSDLHFSVNKHQHVALVGNNGAGKSTLLRLIAGILPPSSGTVNAASKPYYVPQLFGQFNDQTVAQALGVNEQLTAFYRILDGDASAENLALLNDDWTLEERCTEAFAQWQLQDVQLSQPLGSLSGGQKTRVFLAGIAIHQPEIVLLDEPSNHLDAAGRALLYDYVRTAKETLVVVSHDRALLHLIDTIYELNPHGLTAYGGNYAFYAEQQQLEQEARDHELKSREKALRKAKETEKEALERRNKLDARGKKKQEKAGLPTISMNTLRNNAEKSTSRMKGVHAEKTSAMAQELSQLRQALPGADRMKVDLAASSLHSGKLLIDAQAIQFTYDDRPLWNPPLTFQLRSGERVALKGANGSGKTTLIRLLLGELKPQSGSLTRTGASALYIDQDYSLIDNSLSVYEQAQQLNTGALQEHEVKTRLNRFLFPKETWDKPCAALSGGEKMRLLLCSLTIAAQAPDIIVLDEPTNNLDLHNTDILTAAIQAYRGTLIVVSHDAQFLADVGVERTLVEG